MNSTRSLAHLPPRPTISRFVAPWDTSGWYIAATDFANGSRLYTNADIVALDVPRELLGGDSIVTFDSHSDRFDDKQGVIFSVERNARVYVALDPRADSHFLPTFEETGLTLGVSNGLRYRLFARNFRYGDEVRLPGFSGDCHHYAVIVCPLGDDPEAACPSVARSHLV